MNLRSFQIALGVCIATMGMMKSFALTDDSMEKALREKETKRNKFRALSDQQKWDYVEILERRWKDSQKDWEDSPKDLKDLQKDLKDSQKDLKILNDNLIRETDLRLRLQAIVDFNVLVKGLFEESYPEWGETRSNTDFSAEAWHTMFLNIENERIVAMKIEMRKGGITEQEFIKAVNQFSFIRNAKAHLHALTNEEREKAYPKLLAVSKHEQKVALASMLKFSYIVNSKNEVITKEGTIPRANAQPVPKKSATSSPSHTNKDDDDDENKLLTEVVSDTKTARKKRNLLIISNFNGNTPNEESLANELNEKEETKIRACLVHNKKVFLLLEDFERAYAALQHFIKERKYSFTGIKSAVIRNSTDFSLYKNQNAILKITVPENLEATDTAEILNSLKQHVTKIANDHNFEQPALWQLANAKMENVHYFVRFRTLEHLLITYHETKKKEFLSKRVVVSVMPESATSAMTSTYSTVVASLR